MLIFFYIMFSCFYKIMQIKIDSYIIVFKISIVYFSIKCCKENIIVINYLTVLIDFLLFLIIFNLHSSMLLMHEFALNKI